MSDRAAINTGIDAQIREVRRELGQRAHVYPRLVNAGKLTQLKADIQTATLKAVLETLEKIKTAMGADETAAAVDQAEQDLFGGAR